MTSDVAVASEPPSSKRSKNHGGWKPPLLNDEAWEGEAVRLPPNRCIDACTDFASRREPRPPKKTSPPGISLDSGTALIHDNSLRPWAGIDPDHLHRAIRFVDEIVHTTSGL